MPSSHAAMVSALTTAIALTQGMGSVAFGISAIFALIVMYDAAGGRQSVGQQSVALNRIIRELGVRTITELEQNLKEIMGHTVVQVIVGGLLGIAITCLWFIIAG